MAKTTTAFLCSIWFITGIGICALVFFLLFPAHAARARMAVERVKEVSLIASIPQKNLFQREEVFHDETLPPPENYQLTSTSYENYRGNFLPGQMTFNFLNSDGEAFVPDTREGEVIEMENFGLHVPTEGRISVQEDDGGINSRTNRVQNTASVAPRIDVRNENPLLSRVFASAPSHHRNEIALTIDDGWDPVYVARTLEILQQEQVTATLFPAGVAVRGNEELWRQAVNDGHELGNHTFSHAFLSRISDTEIHRQINLWQTEINAALGYEYKTKWFRPPGMGGFVHDPFHETHYRKILKQYDLDVALWDVDLMASVYQSEGLGVDPKKVVDHVVSRSHGGNIILLHFIKPDIEALPEIIRILKERGYSFKTLSEITEESHLVYNS